MHLTRIRTSAHNLGIELGRHKNLPLDKRICRYCSSSTNEPSIDTEFHFLIQCPVFKISRSCLYGKFSSLDPNFRHLPEIEKFYRLLCPKTAQETKVSNKFIKIMLEWREKIDDGVPIDNLGIFFVK